MYIQIQYFYSLYYELSVNPPPFLPPLINIPQIHYTNCKCHIILYVVDRSTVFLLYYKLITNILIPRNILLHHHRIVIVNGWLLKCWWILMKLLYHYRLRIRHSYIISDIRQSTCTYIAIYMYIYYTEIYY